MDDRRLCPVPYASNGPKIEYYRDTCVVINIVTVWPKTCFVWAKIGPTGQLYQCQQQSYFKSCIPYMKFVRLQDTVIKLIMNLPLTAASVDTPIREARSSALIEVYAFETRSKTLLWSFSRSSKIESNNVRRPFATFTRNNYCFWDCNWGCAGQLMTISPLVLVTVPEVFANVYSVQVPFCLKWYTFVKKKVLINC